jgi:Ca2+-binding EF-hand superfamily protein
MEEAKLFIKEIFNDVGVKFTSEPNDEWYRAAFNVFDGDSTGSFGIHEIMYTLKKYWRYFSVEKQNEVDK